MNNKTLLIVAVVAIAIVSILAAVVLSNGNGNGGGEKEEEKVNEMTDTTAGITVLGGDFPAGTELKATPLSDSEMEAALKNNPYTWVHFEGGPAYSIKAMKGDKEVQPSKSVEIVMDSPFSKGMKVLKIDGDSCAPIKSSVNDGKLRFASDSLGTFIVGEDVIKNGLLTVKCENTKVVLLFNDITTTFVYNFTPNHPEILSAYPDDGYEFEGFYIDGELVSDSTLYRFVSESDEDVTITAVSKKAPPKLEVFSYNCDIFVNGQEIKKAGTIEMEPGTHVIAYAVGWEGYTVTGWGGDYTSSTPICEFTFESDTSLTVKSQLSYRGTSIVNASTSSKDGSSDPCGSIVAYGCNVGDKYRASLANGGDPIELTAVPAEGYRFDHWEKGGIVCDTETLTVYSGGYTNAVAVFAPSSYHLLKVSIDYGAVSIDDDSRSFIYLAEGEQTTLNAHSGANKFIGWYSGDKCVSTSEVYTVTMGQSDMVLVGKTEPVPTA